MSHQTSTKHEFVPINFGNFLWLLRWTEHGREPKRFVMVQGCSGPHMVCVAHSAQGREEGSGTGVAAGTQPASAQQHSRHQNNALHDAAKKFQGTPTDRPPWNPHGAVSDNRQPTFSFCSPPNSFQKDGPAANTPAPLWRFKAVGPGRTWKRDATRSPTTVIQSSCPNHRSIP